MPFSRKAEPKTGNELMLVTLSTFCPLYSEPLRIDAKLLDDVGAELRRR